MAKPIWPDDLAKSGTEHGQQAALFCWANLRKDLRAELEWMHAIPNGGARNKATAGMLKAEGVKSGICDIFLPWPMWNLHGMYIEMKVGSNRPTDEQVLFMAEMQKRCYHCVVCYTWRTAAISILRYLNKPLDPLEPYKAQQAAIDEYKRGTIGWHRP